MKPGHNTSTIGDVRRFVKKASYKRNWGGGCTWKRNGYEAHYWPKGRPPVPAAVIANRRKAYNKSRRKDPKRKYRCVRRKRGFTVGQPSKLFPRPDSWQYFTRRRLRSAVR